MSMDTTITLHRPDGASVHVQVRGDDGAPAIVLVHGFGGTSADWDEVATVLVASGHRTIAMDLRGHGRTTAGTDGYRHRALVEDLGAVVEAVGGPPPVVVGHSMGSAVVLGHLATSGRASAAVLTAAVAAAPTSAGQRAAAGLLVSPIGTLLLRTPPVGRRLFAQMLHQPAPPGLAERLRLGILSVPERKAVDRGIRGLDHRPRLPSITVPTVVAAGAEDRATPVDSQRAIADQLGAGRFETVPDAGHFTPLEAPLAIAAIVRRAAEGAAAADST